MEQKEMKKEVFWSGARRGVLWGFMTILCILWAGATAAQILRGNLLGATNTLLYASILALCWTLGKRMERLANTNALLAAEVSRLENVKAFVTALRDASNQRKAEKEAESDEKI